MPVGQRQASIDQQVLDAKSIGYLKVGSGTYLAPLLERLGIAAAIASKVTRPDT